MASESGHHPNRVYVSQAGNIHLNSAQLYDSAGNPVAQAVTYSIAQGGSSNISLITIQVVDGAGTAIAKNFELMVYLSDDPAGNGLTATTASGAVAAGSAGTDLAVKVTKKATDTLTDNTGKYILSITDTSKTGFYIAALCPGTGNVQVSRQLVSGDYK